MAKEIVTSKCQIILVDDEDYDKVNVGKWYVRKDGYASRLFTVSFKTRKHILMHRFIMNAPEGVMVDHINHNKLDNRKENLRFCDNQRNQWNQKAKENTSSDYKGVTKRKYNYEVILDMEYMGKFTNEIAAANAYNYHAKEKYGAFAFLNDVPFMEKEEWESYKTKIEKTSVFNGLSWKSNKGIWEIYVYHKGKQSYIGSSKEEIIAAMKYNEYIIKHGIERPLNIIHN